MLASSNEHKKKEFEAILKGHAVLIPSSFDADETGKTYRENAEIKLRALLAVADMNSADFFLADDSGIEISALSNGPGIYSSRFLHELSQQEKNGRILEMLEGCKDRSARFRTAIAYCAKDKRIHFADGVVEGSIAFEMRGEGGFGYDPIFIPDGQGETVACLGDDFKNHNSHRARAVSSMLSEIYGEKSFCS